MASAKQFRISPSLAYRVRAERARKCAETCEMAGVKLDALWTDGDF